MDWSNDAPRLIYLVVLGVFIASYLAGDFRHRLNQTLQTAVIWVLIFMAAIAAYSFRDLIGGELFSSTPQLTEDGGITINRQDDGHFYITLQANGQDVEFAVDTGASEIVLTQADAQSIGLDLATLDFVGQATTANGIVQTADAILTSLDAPGMALNNVRVSVNGGELDVSLLGMTYLERFDSITIEGDRMTLKP